MVRVTIGPASGKIVEKGLSLGSVLAMILSYNLNHSICWTIFHGICSWLYVIYFVFVH